MPDVGAYEVVSNPPPPPPPPPVVIDVPGALLQARTALQDVTIAQSELHMSDAWKKFQSTTTSHIYKCDKALTKTINDLKTVISKLVG